MIIRIERNPDFWGWVAGDAVVAGGLFGVTAEVVAGFCTRPDVLPIAAEHGGYIFARTDPLGMICEVHSLFTPAGWGREAVRTGLGALGFVFGGTDYRLVTTLEVDGNPRSKPPRRCGFIPAGDWRDTPRGRFRLWLLTRDAWLASPYGAAPAPTLH